MLYNIVIVSIGLFISLLLFYRFPTLKNREKVEKNIGKEINTDKTVIKS